MEIRLLIRILLRNVTILISRHVAVLKAATRAPEKETSNVVQRGVISNNLHLTSLRRNDH